jgi:myeloid differentiation primary response protein MyD88
MNPEQLLTSDDGHARDYRGLAELMGFSYTQIQNFKRSHDPFSAILESHLSRPTGKDASVEQLLLMIEQIGRYDIIDDMAPYLREDLEYYYTKKQNTESQDDELFDESKILTLNDILTGQETLFDAYVCYADADLPFVKDISTRLQASGITLFIRERDLPAGVLQHDVLTQLMEKRCRRVLMILSPAFLDCKECQHQTQIVTSLAVTQGTRKVIPVVHKSCDKLPASLNMITKIDFTHGVAEWSWNKLIMSIKDSKPLPGKSNQNLISFK